MSYRRDQAYLSQSSGCGLGCSMQSSGVLHFPQAVSYVGGTTIAITQCRRFTEKRRKRNEYKYKKNIERRSNKRRID